MKTAMIEKENMKIKLVRQFILRNFVPMCIKRKALPPTGTHEDFVVFYGFY